MARVKETTLLTAIPCVLRARAPHLLALDHVAHLINSLLDSSVQFSLEKAAANGCVRLFDRVYAHTLMATEPPQTPTSAAADACLLDYKLGKAMCVAVAHGDMAMVERIHSLHPQRLPVRLLPLAADNGDLQMLQWLLTHRFDGLCALDSYDGGDGASTISREVKELRGLSPPCPISGPSSLHVFSQSCLTDAYSCAIQKNHLHIVKWLLQNGYDASKCHLRASDVACSMGDLDFVKWLHMEDVPGSFTKCTLDVAARVGHLEIVQFLLDNRSEGFTSAAVHHAVAGGYSAIYEALQASSGFLPKGYFHPIGLWSKEAAMAGRLDLLQSDQSYAMEDAKTQMLALHAACKHGHLEVVQWIVEHHKVECGAEKTYVAAIYGHVHILKWIHEAGCGEWHRDAMDDAAELGKLEVVQWLHGNRPEARCTTKAMDFAARNGHLDVVQWLHVNRTEGCTTAAMDGAAAHGHLDVVQFLHSNRTEGCSTRAMDGAAAHGHLDVVQWLHVNRIEGCTSRAMHLAAANGHLEVVIWLEMHRTEGCKASTMDKAAPIVLQWFHWHPQYHASFTTSAMDNAAFRGDLATLAFLHAHRTEGCSSHAFDSVAGTGHLSIMQWLFERYPDQIDVQFVRIFALGERHTHIVKWLQDQGL